MRGVPQAVNYVMIRSFVPSAKNHLLMKSASLPGMLMVISTVHLDAKMDGNKLITKENSVNFRK